MRPILILGATGNIAAPVARELAAKDDVRLRLTSRSEAGRDKLRAEFPGAEIMSADWLDKTSLDRAFDGIHGALMVTPDFTDEVTAVANVLAAAKGSPVFEHLVRLIAIPPIAKEDMTEEWLRTNAGVAMHWMAMEAFRGTDIPITFVNVPTWTDFHLVTAGAQSVRERRELPMKGDAARLWISEDDMGEVFAKILREGPKQHVGRTYVLTGPMRHRFGEIAEMISDEIGEKVTWVESDESFKLALGEHAEALTTYARYSSKHAEKQQHTKTLEELLGRAPTTLREYIARYRASFI
ncbi:NmrA family NAD(P)-binding protein [Mesorhizobium sp. CU2]|uniref:NmrA family NAD(P)-binding protein n=2 Tax=unclassified Mesorhizobium TaxID=325217 RepID=UPI001FEED0D3|nr:MULTISPECIES: NmrA family NAD(P)-binding protein [unclassified Mesorhizobium]